MKKIFIATMSGKKHYSCESGILMKRFFILRDSE